MSEPSATSAAVISADAPSRKEKKRRSRPRREALPAGWTEMRHNNGLPFYYHTESGTVCWTRPYVRKFKVEEHAPLLSSFAIVLEDHTSDDPAKTARDEASLEEELASNALQSGSGLEPATEEQSAVLESMEDLYEGSTLDQGPDQGDELEEGELIEEGDIEPAEEVEHEPGTEPEGEGAVTESGHAIKARALALVTLLVSKEKRRKRRTTEYGAKRGVKKRSAEDLSGVGKTPISFLQEYCLNIIKKTPNYRVTIQEDSKAPFVTEVVLDDAVIGRGSFSNKKTSKQLAALESLEHLCPGQYPRELLLKNVNLEVALKDDLNETRHLSIDDEKIMNLDGTSAKTPVQVLQEYCNREGSYVHYNSEEIGTSETKNRFSVTATLDQLQAEGTGKTKKEAKQRAAQLLLKQLHSDINTWGELLDYYETQKELHKDKGPNLQLLNLLKEKMRSVPSIIQEQSTTAPKASEVTPVIVLTSDLPLVSPVPLSDAEFYRVKDKSCKDLDTEHNTPSHSPVVSRHNSFIHKARLRKEPVSESVASESKGPSESAVESIDVDAERKRRRESDAHEDEPQRKVRKMDEGLSDSNTNSGKDNER